MDWIAGSFRGLDAPLLHCGAFPNRYFLLYLAALLPGDLPALLLLPLDGLTLLILDIPTGLSRHRATVPSVHSSSINISCYDFPVGVDPSAKITRNLKPVVVVSKTDSSPGIARDPSLAVENTDSTPEVTKDSLPVVGLCDSTSNPPTARLIP